MKFQQIIDQLNRCKIQGGVWIDAGCGNGTYTFPLATLVDNVIAIDKNSNDLSYLNSRITTETNILTKQIDFNSSKWFDQLVDGILFGFSLHYHPIPQIAIKNAFNQLKSGGIIIIVDYTSETPVSWIPHPLPLVKLNPLLRDLPFTDIQVIETLSSRKRSSYWNNESYVIKAMKK